MQCKILEPPLRLSLTLVEPLLVRSEIIIDVLQGETDRAINTYKTYVQEHQTLQNMIWYGRILATGNVDRQKESINLFRRLANREKAGDKNWLLIKSDLILSLYRSAGAEMASKEIEYVLSVAPSTPAAWKTAVESKTR